jgi:hypothetical protein
MGSHIPEAAPPLYYIDIAGYTPQPVQGEDWWYDYDQDLFTSIDPGVKEPARSISAKELWFRSFTSLERSYVWAICNGETPPGVTINIENRYRIAAFKDLTGNGHFPLDEPELVIVIDGMESAGIISAGRADEILER